MEKNTHIYLTVMGTMGSGKTTVAKLIAKNFGCTLIEENFGENQFLSRFYEDMPRWAFHSQTFFLMEKITQMLETKTLVQKTSVVQDTPLTQDVFSYAKAQHSLGNMDDAEWRLFKKIYMEFLPYLLKPHGIIFLETSLPVIQNRIVLRGRGYEKEISQKYLTLLDTLNHEWLSTNTEIPVFSFCTDTVNIVHSGKDQEYFLTSVKKWLSHLPIRKNT